MRRQFDDVQLGSLELFCLAAEHGSFTTAATLAGVSPAAVSRSVGRLEARLGVRLFVRSTRHIALTEGGRAYFEQARPALEQLLEAERVVSGQQQTPAGTLRLSMPTNYGQFRVLPLLPAFRERYPQIALELHIGNRNVDFVEEGFDLAIRAREGSDSRMIYRRLEDAPLVVVAAPTYLKRAGTPRTLDDLAVHDCIQFALPSSGRAVPWQFRQAGQDVDLMTQGGISTHDDIHAGVTLARNGGGLYQIYRYMVEEELRRGTLVEVLQEFAGRSRPFSLVYPHGRYLPQRVRTLVDFLLEAVGRV